MLQMLKDKTSVVEDAERLSFLMSYVFAWNWLQQNINTQYQEEVLSSFCKGPQAFLMQMLLQSNSTAEFIQAYIQYWQQYRGEAQLQQRNLLQLLQLLLMVEMGMLLAIYSQFLLLEYRLLEEISD